jgi:predicted alpha/beta superfamily hydrolase
MWQPYTETVQQHTVVGDLQVYKAFYSPQLDNTRDILVWLPPSYATSGRRYPVIYMHDGQNLFDAYTSNSGEWQTDETLTALASEEGLEAIIVGLPHMGERRPIEYSPYDDVWNGAHYQGRGKDYVRFIVESVKPLIDDSFRTSPEATTTGIAGASMGGLISLYAFLTRPDIFGVCASLSTAYWFGSSGLLQTIAAHANGQGWVWLDVGTHEGTTLEKWYGVTENADLRYVEGVRQLRDALLARRYTLHETLMYVEEDGAPHHESAWARRLPNALRFLLAS